MNKRLQSKLAPEDNARVKIEGVHCLTWVQHKSLGVGIRPKLFQKWRPVGAGLRNCSRCSDHRLQAWMMSSLNGSFSFADRSCSGFSPCCRGSHPLHLWRSATLPSFESPLLGSSLAVPEPFPVHSSVQSTVHHRFIPRLVKRSSLDGSLLSTKPRKLTSGSAKNGIGGCSQT